MVADIDIQVVIKFGTAKWKDKYAEKTKNSSHTQFLY